MGGASQDGTVVPLNAARERRRFIDAANANENWVQTRASFALEGIALTDDDAGRLIAGVITQEQGYAEIRHEAGVTCGGN